jgi:hypothetical protein
MFPRPRCIGNPPREKGGNAGNAGTSAARRGFHGRGTGNVAGTQRGRLGTERERFLVRAAL